MANANLLRVPHFLAAPTRDELVQLMMLNNLKHGIEFRYFDIQKDGRSWIAWFNWEEPGKKKQLLVDSISKEANG